MTDLESVPHGETPADEVRAVVLEKLADAETPGFLAEFDPEEAEWAGAFVEDALSEPEALASTMDRAEESSHG